MYKSVLYKILHIQILGRSKALRSCISGKKRFLSLSTIMVSLYVSLLEKLFNRWFLQVVIYTRFHTSFSSVHTNVKALVIGGHLKVTVKKTGETVAAERCCPCIVGICRNNLIYEKFYLASFKNPARLTFS